MRTTKVVIEEFFVATQIRKLIEKSGLKRKQFAEEAEVSYSMMNRWLEGKNVPTIDQLWKICVFCGVSPNEMMGWDE